MATTLPSGDGTLGGSADVSAARRLVSSTHDPSIVDAPGQLDSLAHSGADSADSSSLLTGALGEMLNQLGSGVAATSASDPFRRQSTDHTAAVQHAGAQSWRDRKPVALRMPALVPAQRSDEALSSVVAQPSAEKEALTELSPPRTPFENPVSAIDYITARGGPNALGSTVSPLAMWSSRIAGNGCTAAASTGGTIFDNTPHGLNVFTGWGFGEAMDTFELDTDEEEDCQGGLLSGSPEKWANILARITPGTARPAPDTQIARAPANSMPAPSVPAKSHARPSPIDAADRKGPNTAGHGLSKSPSLPDFYMVASPSTCLPEHNVNDYNRPLPALPAATTDPSVAIAHSTRAAVSADTPTAPSLVRRVTRDKRPVNELLEMPPLELYRPESCRPQVESPIRQSPTSNANMPSAPTAPLTQPVDTLGGGEARGQLHATTHRSMHSSSGHETRSLVAPSLQHQRNPSTPNPGVIAHQDNRSTTTQSSRPMGTKRLPHELPAQMTARSAAMASQHGQVNTARNGGNQYPTDPARTRQHVEEKEREEEERMPRGRAANRRCGEPGSSQRQPQRQRQSRSLERAQKKRPVIPSAPRRGGSDESVNCYAKPSLPANSSRPAQPRPHHRPNGAELAGKPRPDTAHTTKHRLQGAAASTAGAGNSIEPVTSRRIRRLLRFGPALQVITSKTVKDRMLFLFQSVLLVVKPILSEGHSVKDLNACNLDTRYQCRAVIPLGDVSMASMREEAMSPPDLSNLMDPSIAQAVRRFTRQASCQALQRLLDRNILRGDAASIAGFLLRTRGLDRQEVGRFLARRENVPVFVAFLERVPARGVELVDMLRLLGRHLQVPAPGNTALPIRSSNVNATCSKEAIERWQLPRTASQPGVLPDDRPDPDSWLRSVVLIAERWRVANVDYKLGRRAAMALVCAVLTLDARRQRVGGELSHGCRFDEFHQYFARNFGVLHEENNRPVYVAENLLRRLFEAAKSRPVLLDRAAEELAVVEREQLARTTKDLDPSGRLWISVGTFPLRLTVRVLSPEVVISLPMPDPGLRIRVLCESELRCSESILSFAESCEARITLTGVSVGRCVIAFDLQGPSAVRYSPIPPRTLSIERSFMRWAFRLRCSTTYFSLDDIPLGLRLESGGAALGTLTTSVRNNSISMGVLLGEAASVGTPNAGTALVAGQVSRSRYGELASSAPTLASTRLPDSAHAEGLAAPFDESQWRGCAVGVGRSVKMSFSVDSPERQTGWCNALQERASIVRELRDKALPANAALGDADQPGCATRDRWLATRLAQRLLPAKDESASTSHIFTGKELTQLVTRYECALAE